MPTSEISASLDPRCFKSQTNRRRKATSVPPSTKQNLIPPNFNLKWRIDDWRFIYICPEIISTPRAVPHRLNWVDGIWICNSNDGLKEVLKDSELFSANISRGNPWRSMKLMLKKSSGKVKPVFENSQDCLRKCANGPMDKSCLVASELSFWPSQVRHQQLLVAASSWWQDAQHRTLE